MGAILIVTVAWLSSEYSSARGGATFIALLYFLGGLINAETIVENLGWVVFNFIYCYLYFSLLIRVKDQVIYWILVMLAGGVGWVGIPLLLIK
jgi:hypothetical protein